MEVSVAGPLVNLLRRTHTGVSKTEEICYSYNDIIIAGKRKGRGEVGVAGRGGVRWHILESIFKFLLLHHEVTDEAHP